jgi:mercuric ion transport protein
LLGFQSLAARCNSSPARPLTLTDVIPAIFGMVKGFGLPGGESSDEARRWPAPARMVRGTKRVAAGRIFRLREWRVIDHRGYVPTHGTVLATGAGAVLAASCCVLPLVLGGLGAGAGLFSTLEVLADYQTPILVFSVCLVALAWVVYFRRRGARSTAVVLATASLFVVTAANWAALERPLLKIVRASR